jgi:Trypsin
MHIRWFALAFAFALAAAGAIAGKAETDPFSALSARSGSPRRITEAGRAPHADLGLAGTAAVGAGRRGGMRLAQAQLHTHGIVLGTPGDVNAIPFKWAGMLRFKGPDGNRYLCSGQFIAPQVVLTAGHCLYDLQRRAYSSDFTFLLQYDRGTYSHEYRWRCASKPAQYSLPAAFDSHSDDQKKIDLFRADQYDYAMILVNSPSITGYFKNWDGSWKKGDWHGATRIGYPADVMNAQLMQEAHGVVFFPDDIPFVPGASFPRLLALLQFSPYLTEGTSGGGWIGNLSSVDAPDNNVLVSVNSFHLPKLPVMEFGPQFDKDQFRSLLNHVASGGCAGQ